MLWLILGILIGAGAFYLWKNPEVKLAWYDWLILAVAVVFLLLGITNFNGSMAELEPTAAWFLLASFGLPGLILAAIVVIRLWRERQTAS